MKTKILLLLLLGWVGVILAQEKINESKINVNSQFIFDDFTKGVECTKEGNIVMGSIPVSMPVDAIFNVVGKTDDNKYIVKFLRWKLNTNNISKNLDYYYKAPTAPSTLRSAYKRHFLILIQERF
ncbi:hypothetical protein EJ377_06630 [Chryseobacterium arthrosphaerae]|uniref:Uncharacterized protein n=1 Tax=Chryseobacterium arthrosphaerae TaxID=651561 RepID=A0A432E0G6_9FLAO|nr:hypothetical protein EJ377_06630 [Chryseobacterium arthrosphaerae]